MVRCSFVKQWLETSETIYYILNIFNRVLMVYMISESNSFTALTKNVAWSPSQFMELHAPFSPCVTVQWTYRDGHIVNLPCSFLVEGDIILLRPGQEVPAHCRLFQVGF